MKSTPPGTARHDLFGLLGRGGRIMSRRLFGVAALAAGLMLATMPPAAAVGPFAPAEVVIGGCAQGYGDAAIAADGTTRGFADCTDFRSGRIWFFRDQPGTAPVREPSPYTGVVLAVAWDGLDSTYVVFQYGTQLKIGKRVESSGAYSPLTTLAAAPSGTGYRFGADLVAANGRWWAVWSELTATAGLEFAQTQLFQRHTLLSVQGRTRITNTALTVSDAQPTLAYAGGRMTLVWTRFTPFSDQSDLRIAQSTGAAWLSRPFASAGNFNEDADVTSYAGVTWVTWTRDQTTVVADNSGGTFRGRTFATPGNRPTVAVSGRHTFVAWFATGADRVVLAELSDGTWTSGQVAGARSVPLRVLAQATRARVIYSADDIATGDAALYIRTQT